MKLLKPFLILFFIVLKITDTFSQDHHCIEGYLVHQEQPIEFGYVIVKQSKDSLRVIGTAITDSAGFFHVKLSGVFAYPFKINATFQHLSFEEKQIEIVVNEASVKEVKLGKIDLPLRDSNLDEVTVSAQRQLIKKEGSKLIYSISQDSNSKGKNLENILNGLPGVSVAHDGSLKLLGSSNVKILIDGKDLNTSSEELKNMLKSYSSEIIESIEVVTSPSAEYDASFTRIININLNQDRVGWTSTIASNHERTIASKLYLSNYTAYNSERINFTADINYGNSRDYEYSDFARTIYTNEVATRVVQTNKIKVVNKNYNLGGSLTYKINERNSITGAIKYNNLKEGIPSTGKTAFAHNLNKIDSLIDSQNNSDNKLGALLYRIGFENFFGKDSALNKLWVEYNRANYTIPSIINNFSTFHYDGNSAKEFKLATDIESKLQLDIFKLDVTPSFGEEIGLVVGGKISSVNYRNRFVLQANPMGEWVLDSVDFNQYQYKEENFAGFFKVQYSIQNWSFNGGLRVERTSLANKIDTQEGNLVDSAYIKWFPSFTLLKKLNDYNEIGFNYTRRITRPSYGDLDPTFFVLDPYSYLQGNISLKPQLNTVYELIYILRKKHLLAISLTQNANVIVQTPTQFSTILRLQPLNYKEATFIDLYLSTPFNISKWWKLNPEFSFYKRNYINIFNEEEVENNNYSYYFSINNDFTLPQDFLVNFNFLYQGPDIAGIYKTDKYYTFSLNVRKAFLNDKLNLSLSLKDIFKTYEIINRVNELQQDLLIKQSFDSRAFSISASYTFSKGKKVKANKQEYNEEEFRRVK